MMRKFLSFAGDQRERVGRRIRRGFRSDKKNHFTEKSLRNTAVLTAAGLLCGLLAGCGLSLAQPGAGMDAADQPQDQLVGVFVTSEWLDLFDHEAWLNDNLDALVQANGGVLEMEDTAQYEDRLYAEFVTDENGDRMLQFPGYEGWYFVHHPNTITSYDGTGEEPGAPDWYAPDDIHSLGTHVSVTDDEDETRYQGVFYFALDTTPRAEREDGVVSEVIFEDGTAGAILEDDLSGTTYYVNPVYVTADGQVYATAGHGVNMSSNESEGESYGITLSTSYTDTTTTGEGVTESQTVTTTYELKFYGVWPTTQYRFLQLNADGALLRTDAFAVDALPEALEILAGTDCLLVERTYADRDGKTHTDRLAFDRSENFVDGSRKEGDLIWTYDYTAADGAEGGAAQTAGVILCLPVPNGNGCFDSREVRLDIVG